VSLRELLKHYALVFCRIGASLEAIQCKLEKLAQQHHPNAPFGGRGPEAKQIESMFRGLAAHCVAIDLDNVAPQVERMIIDLHDGCMIWEMRESVRNLALRIDDQLQGRKFLYLPPSRVADYEQPKRGWDDVLESFPSVVDEISESGRCFALGQYTASAFHSMRIAEAGVRALGVSLHDPGIDPKKNPSWEKILARCNAELNKEPKHRSTEWQRNGDRLTEATLYLRGVKEAWRNPTMHVEKDYNEEQASDVRSAVRTLMRHLATFLHE
jgi:hypothetical protein